MAQKECTGTAAIAFVVSGQAQTSAYYWCTRQDIQAYLDEDSTIVIGSSNDSTANFDEVTAKLLENHKVELTVAYLSSAYTISTSSSADVLTTCAAMMTAAQIGMNRQGAAIGTELAHWTIRLDNAARAALYQLVVNHTLTGSGIIASNIPLWQRLIVAKTRERTIVPNV